MRSEPTVITQDLRERLSNVKDFLPDAAQDQQQFAAILANGMGPTPDTSRVRAITPSHFKYHIDTIARRAASAAIGYHNFGWGSSASPGQLMVMGSDYQKKVIEIVSAVDNNGPFSERFAELYR